jgi:hypothetical protein
VLEGKNYLRPPRRSFEVRCGRNLRCHHARFDRFTNPIFSNRETGRFADFLTLPLALIPLPLLPLAASCGGGRLTSLNTLCWCIV